MNKVELKDNVGRILGTIIIYDNGKRELRDFVGRYLGSYDPKDNLTRNEIGAIIGKGDLLTTLLRN